MPPTLEAELLATAYALLFGAFLGLFYDGMRVFHILLGIRDGSAPACVRARIRPPRLFFEKKSAAPRRIARGSLLFLCDFLYALLSGIAFLIFLYASHDGAFRLFLLLAVFLGMLLYFFTLGRLVSSVLGTLALLTRASFGYLFLCLYVPVRFLFCLCLFLFRAALFLFLSLLARILSPLASKWALFSSRQKTRAFFSGATHTN